MGWENEGITFIYPEIWDAPLTLFGLYQLNG
jgi:hypothetical protein